MALELDKYVYPGTRFMPSGHVHGEGQGMSVRDAAALAALQGICANPNVVCREGHERYLATWVWAIADAFMAARETKEDGG